MKNILCFGDSNTWGYTPGTAVRYDIHTRYTGVMQDELGAEYRILLLELLDKLVTQVPIWKLRCNMDPDAAEVAYEAMNQ